VKRLVAVWLVVVAVVLVVAALGQVDPWRVGPTGALNPAGGPVTPPASVTAFFGITSVEFDTVTDGADVELTVRGYAQGGDGLANWQWRQHHDDAWATLDTEWWSDGEGDDSTYARVLTDTIHTEAAKADLDSVHIRMRGKFTADDDSEPWVYTGPVFMARSPGDTTAPAAPTNLFASGDTASVGLDWDDNSEGDLDHYNIYRARTISITPPGSYDLYAPTVDATSSFTDPYAASGDTLYWYYVTALDATGNESSASNTTIGGPTTDDPPAAPANLFADAGDRQILLEWDANTESDFAYYRVYRNTGIEYVVIANTGTNPAYLDTGLTNDVAYYYYVTATDDGSNESSPSTIVSATPVDQDYVAIEIKNADIADGYIDASGDSLTVEFDIALSKDAWVKARSWYYNNNSDENDASGISPTDTTSGDLEPPYNDWHFLPTTGQVVFNTRIPSTVAVADSTILLEWKYKDVTGEGDPPDSLCLEYSHNGLGNWEVVTYMSTVSGTRTSFRHRAAAADTYQSVRRGIEYYRIFGFNGSRENFSLRMPNADEADPYNYLDSPYYNQAVDAFFQIDADDGVKAVSTSVPVQVTFSPVYVEGPDETAPVIASRTVDFDTTAAGNVILELQVSSAGSEPALVQWQWGPAHDATMTPVTAYWWHAPGHTVDDSTHAYTMNDTIHTLYGVDGDKGAYAALDSVHIQYRIKDASDNVSDWANVDTTFVRETPTEPGDWDGTVVISNSTTAYGDSAGTTWVTDNVYAAALDLSCSSPGCGASYNSADTDWESVAKADSWPYAPFSTRYARPFSSYPGGLRFTQGDGARVYPFFSFGSSAELEGATINSATLYLKTADIDNQSTSFTNMVASDSVYVYSCARDTVLHQWLNAPNPNDNISYMNAKVDSSVAWLTPVLNWDTSYSAGGSNPMFGVHVSADPISLGNTEDAWISFDVTRLVIEQEQYDAPLMFYMCFNSEADHNYTAFSNMGYDNGNGGAIQANRPYLVLDVTGTEEEDTTAPAMVSLSAVAFDTTNTSNVRLDVAMTADGAALGWWQFKHMYDGTWNPTTPEWYSSSKHDSLFLSSISDTIMSTYSTADLDSVYVRVSVKDALQNVSDWFDPSDDEYTEARKFARQDGGPPDTTGLFTSLAYDTTYTENVRIDLVLSNATAPEDIQIWHQWKYGAGGTWSPAERWRPTTPASTITDTIYTTLSTFELTGATTYTRYKARDVSLNETDWSDEYEMAFVRKAVAGPAAWLGHTIISNTATHPITRDANYGTVDSTTIDQWIGDWGSTQMAAINMYDSDHTVTSVLWGDGAGYNDNTNPVPFGSFYARSNVGGWHVGGGGTKLRVYPLFNFGDADSFAGATIDSAKLWIRVANYSFSDTDSLFVYSMTGMSATNQGWVNDPDDVSFEYLDTGSSTAWSPDLEDTWTREGVGGAQVGYAIGDFGGVTHDFFHPPIATWQYMIFNVTDLLQDQADNDKPLTYYITFRSSTASSGSIYDNGTDGAAQSNRFYLEVWASE